MTTSTNFSVSIDFGKKDNPGVSTPVIFFTVEVDTRPTGFNGGKTTFSAGETIHYLIRKSWNVQILTEVATVGVIHNHPDSKEHIIDDYLFLGVNTVNLKTPCEGNYVDYDWIGDGLGGIRVINSTQLISSRAGDGVLRVKYDTPVLHSSLSTPSSVNGITDYQVILTIKARCFS